MTTMTDEPADTMARTLPAWDAASVVHLPRKERQAAYFRWHKQTKKLSIQFGIPMPVRPKRAKAASDVERIERSREKNAESRSKRVGQDRDRNRIYYSANQKGLLEKKRSARLESPDVFRKRGAVWRENNPDKVRAMDQSPRTKLKRTARHRVRQKTDIQYRMRRHLRKHVHWCVKAYGNGKGRKSASVIALVGCSIENLISHLEVLWWAGMSWDNYGIRGWHIDHKVPCASFDFSDPDQQKACFHYTNLQPLWALDNHKKGARLDWHPLPTEERTNAYAV